MMQRGPLRFTSWEAPWLIAMPSGDVDLREHALDLFARYAGQTFRMAYDLHSFVVQGDHKGDMRLEYDADEAPNPTLWKADGSFGFSNLGAYLSNALQRLNGREVMLDLSTDGFRIWADPAENVPPVLFEGEGNYGGIPADEVISRCQPGTTTCCAFLTASASGFECAKFCSYTARSILHRIEEGTFRATRIGNCKLMGRKERVA